MVRSFRYVTMPGPAPLILRTCRRLATSTSASPPPRAVLYQAVVVSGSEPGIAMGGTHVDENQVLAADFGQWDLDR